MKKNVAIVIPSLTGGGAERVASNLSIYLPEEQYNKYVIVFDNSQSTYPHGGELINMDIKASSGPVGKIANIVKRTRALKNIKKKYQIDTTISFLDGANIVNIRAKLKGWGQGRVQSQSQALVQEQSQDQVIVSVRNFISKSSKGLYGRVFNSIVRHMYNKADAVVAVSQALKQDLIENFKLDREKVQVIYNPYDMERIQEQAKDSLEEGLRGIFQGDTVITVGRLSQQKGQWHLIRAFRMVKEEVPDARLVIVGQGELREYLEQLAKNLGLQEDVHFLGFKDNPFKYIANSEVYAFPSLYEGFPNALCEAMACGIPVVSADCKSGPREILAPDTSIELEAQGIEHAEYGVLVPVCDGEMYGHDEPLTDEERMLGEAIVGMLKSKDLAKGYSGKALERVADLDMTNIVKLWEELI